MQSAAFADCVEHHGLRVLRRVGLQLEARLARIARAGEVEPRLRDLVLQGKRGRGAAGRDPRLGLAQVVEGKCDLGAMEGRDAAIDRVFIGKEVVVDGRLALFELAGERLLDAGPGGGGEVENVLDLLARESLLELGDDFILLVAVMRR